VPRPTQADVIPASAVGRTRCAEVDLVLEGTFGRVAIEITRHYDDRLIGLPFAWL
jgi:hypothetical protein